MLILFVKLSMYWPLYSFRPFLVTVIVHCNLLRILSQNFYLICELTFCFPFLGDNLVSVYSTCAVRIAKWMKALIKIYVLLWQLWIQSLGLVVLKVIYCFSGRGWPANGKYTRENWISIECRKKAVYHMDWIKYKMFDSKNFTEYD